MGASLLALAKSIYYLGVLCAHRIPETAQRSQPLQGRQLVRP